MSNLTKAQRKSEQKIEDAIYRGYKRGVCDINGKNIKDEHGMPIKLPRGGPVTRRFIKRNDGTWGWEPTDFAVRHGMA